MQAQEEVLGLGRPLVHVVHPQPFVAGEILEIAGLEAPAGEVGEALFRRAERFGHDVVWPLRLAQRYSSLSGQVTESIEPDASFT